MSIINEELLKLFKCDETRSQYFDLIKENITRNKIKGKTDQHHILPKSIYPEYKNSKWNKVNLLFEDHFLAHYFLATGTKDGKMIKALHMMMHGNTNNKRRDIGLVIDTYSAQYAEARRLVSEYCIATDTRTDEIVYIPVEDFKSHDFYVGTSTSKVTCFDNVNQTNVMISLDEFYINRSRYIKHSKGMVSVIDTLTGETKQITVQNRLENSNRYKGVTLGKVPVINSETGEKAHVNVEEYHMNDKLIHATTGHVAVKNIKTNKMETISKLEFNNNRSMYVGVTKGRTPAFNLLTKERVFVSKEEFSISEFLIGHNTKRIRAFNLLREDYEIVEKDEFIRSNYLVFK